MGEGGWWVVEKPSCLQPSTTRYSLWCGVGESRTWEAVALGIGSHSKQCVPRSILVLARLEREPLHDET